MAVALAVLLSLLVLEPTCHEDRDGAETGPKEAEDGHPERCATPVPWRKGLANLHKVTDTLYRGAQPEEGGFAELKAAGVKTVVNLRILHRDRSECRKGGLGHVPITAQTWEEEDDEVIDFLRAATDPERQAVFVHCQHGSDRTGLVCAVYRGWSRAGRTRKGSGR